MSTRREMKQQARGWAKQPSSGPGRTNPITANEMLDMRVDEIARAIRGVHVTLREDIVSGQFLYCPPPLFELEEVTIRREDGEQVHLMIRSPDQMKNIDPQWRFNTETDTPRYAVTEGQTGIRLYPVPGFDRTQGLIYRGLGTCKGAWDEETDECPLPVLLQPTAIIGLALDMAIDAENFKRAAWLEDRWLRGLAQADGEANTWTQEQRNRDQNDEPAYRFSELDM